MALTKPSNWQAGFPRTHRTTGCILTAASSYTRRLSWQGNLPRRSLRHITVYQWVLSPVTGPRTRQCMLSVQSQQRRLNEGSWLHAEGHSNTGKSTGISTWFMFGVEPNSRALSAVSPPRISHTRVAHIRDSNQWMLNNTAGPYIAHT